MKYGTIALFMPFIFRMNTFLKGKAETDNADTLRKCAGQAFPRWTVLEDQTSYFLRYVIDSRKGSTVLLMLENKIHQEYPGLYENDTIICRDRQSGAKICLKRIDENRRPEKDSIANGTEAGAVYAKGTENYEYSVLPENEKYQQHFRIAILNKYIFLSASGIGCVSFYIRAADAATQTPTDLADLCFALKRVDNSPFVKTAQEILKKSGMEEYCLFPFFVNSSDTMFATMDFFAYAECKGLPDDKLPGILYHMKYGYRKNFNYSENCTSFESEEYRPVEGITWTASSEGISCIAYDMKMQDEKDNISLNKSFINQGSFLEKTFRKNLEQNYFPMFLSILQQKYAIYKLLNEFSGRSLEELTEAELRDWNSRLTNFKTQNDYTILSETSQYQGVSRIMRNAMHLEALYENVQEKIDATTNILERKSERRVNNALAGLSLIAIFSILTDSYSWISNNLPSLVGPDFATHIPAAIVTVIVIGLWAFISKDIFISLFDDIKERRKR